jgi:3-methyladenine DNA glycosylase/8-oxoguanine DNA glycosylase
MSRGRAQAFQPLRTRVVPVADLWMRRANQRLYNGVKYPIAKARGFDDPVESSAASQPEGY